MEVTDLLHDLAGLSGNRVGPNIFVGLRTSSVCPSGSVLAGQRMLEFV